MACNSVMWSILTINGIKLIKKQKCCLELEFCSFYLTSRIYIWFVSAIGPFLSRENPKVGVTKSNLECLIFHIAPF